MYLAPFLSLILTALTRASPVLPPRQSSTYSGANIFLPASFSVPSSSSPFLTSADLTLGLTEWILQLDGNLVIFTTRPGGRRTASWSSGTPGFHCKGSDCTLTFQVDGNLVIYIGGLPVWSTKTTTTQHAGDPGARLEFDFDEGEGAEAWIRVLDAGGADVWATPEAGWLTGH